MGFVGNARGRVGVQQRCACALRLKLFYDVSRLGLGDLGRLWMGSQDYCAEVRWWPTRCSLWQEQTGVCSLPLGRAAEVLQRGPAVALHEALRGGSRFGNLPQGALV